MTTPTVCPICATVDTMRRGGEILTQEGALDLWRCRECGHAIFLPQAAQEAAGATTTTDRGPRVPDVEDSVLASTWEALRRSPRCSRWMLSRLGGDYLHHLRRVAAIDPERRIRYGVDRTGRFWWWIEAMKSAPRLEKEIGRLDLDIRKEAVPPL